ncbi:hypothetical protein MCEMRE226_00002 [Candidatus Nanopelagicaceae bacterium]
MKLAHSSTHTFSSLTHTLARVNKGSDLLFLYLSTVFTPSYYYYLYIYKTRFQADRPQITVLLQKYTYMSARATA